MATGEDALIPAVVGFRLRQLEERQQQFAERESVSSLRATVNERGRDLDKRIDQKADKTALDDLGGDVRQLSEEVRGLRRVIMSFTVAFATGSIAVSLTLIGTYLH